MKLLKWFLMLSKRLYKRLSFLAILVLIPVIIFAFSLVADKSSGFVTIALAQADSNDAISSEVIDELLSEKSIINFVKFDTPTKAIQAVEYSQFDEAWIFPEDMNDKVYKFAAMEQDEFVSIVSREQTVLLRLAHEKLTSALYKHCAKAYYVNFTRNNLPELDGISDSELLEYFDDASFSEELFILDNTSNGNLDLPPQDNYLTSPIRGLLGVLIVLSGMAATMYYMQDEINGTFSKVLLSSRIYVALGSIAIAVINVSCVSAISLFVAGLSTAVFWEILTVLLYTVCCSVFCLLLKYAFYSIKLYGAVIPLFMVIMIALCPVFMDLKSLRALQLLLPPTYYVNSAYDLKYLIYMIIYSAVGFLICYMLQFLKSKRIVLKKAR